MHIQVRICLVDSSRSACQENSQNCGSGDIFGGIRWDMINGYCLDFHKFPKGFIWLVVGFHPSEKYELVTWDDYEPNIWENKKKIQTTNQFYLLEWIFMDV